MTQQYLELLTPNEFFMCYSDRFDVRLAHDPATGAMRAVVGLSAAGKEKFATAESASAAANPAATEVGAAAGSTTVQPVHKPQPAVTPDAAQSLLDRIDVCGAGGSADARHALQGPASVGPDSAG